MPGDPAAAVVVRSMRETLPPGGPCMLTLTDGQWELPPVAQMQPEELPLAS